ncbi:MAG: hypothetical protein IKG56_01250 [Clostridia bacterium]|nr:hypothetical protein [Clostridia bacterium]
MENASKALMIAGGVLLALLVTSLLVIGISRMRHYQNTQNQKIKNEQVAEFNGQYESYNKQVVTGYELVSLGHMTVDSNKRYPVDQGYDPVAVFFTVKDDSNKGVLGGYVDAYSKESDGWNLIKFVDYYDDLSDIGSDYNAKKTFKEAYFKCDKVEYDKNSARIIKMEFSQLTKKE